MFEFGIKDAIDILLVAMMLYYAWRLMKSSGSLNIFYGILVFIVTWIVVSQILEMKLLGSIFDKLVSVGVIALIVLFQEEIRRFFLTLGSQRRLNAIARFFFKRLPSEDEQEEELLVRIVLACDYMSKNMVGALIILEREMSLTDIIKSGETINADINTELIKNIFFKNIFFIYSIVFKIKFVTLTSSTINNISSTIKFFTRFSSKKYNSNRQNN